MTTKDIELTQLQARKIAAVLGPLDDDDFGSEFLESISSTWYEDSEKARGVVRDKSGTLQHGVLERIELDKLDDTATVTRLRIKQPKKR